MKNYQELAHVLQDDPPELDELKRARLEKDFLRKAAVREMAPERAGSNWRMGAARMGAARVAIGVAAGVLLVVGFQSFSASWGDEQTSSASVVALRDGVPVREAALESGETVVTSEGQLLRVRFGTSSNDQPSTLVEVVPESRATFASVDGPDHRVILERGQVRVEFHPRVRGEESLLVQTNDARVLVVGTVFEVTVTEDGTRVSVEEGAVRVEPLMGESFVVSAGSSRDVPRRVNRPDIDININEDDEEPEAARVTPLEPEAPIEGILAENQIPVREALPNVRRRPTPEVAPAQVNDALEEAGETTAETTAEMGTPLERIENALDRARGGGSTPTPLEDDIRFDLARRYFDANSLDQARHELYAIARTTESRRARARAWTVVAETFERGSDPTRAVEAYRRAARVSGTPEAADAMFALARIRVSTGDSAGGRATYEEYLAIAPDGPLASAARRALCRLGDQQYCP